jgi:hypothetical protein
MVEKNMALGVNLKKKQQKFLIERGSDTSVIVVAMRSLF